MAATHIVGYVQVGMPDIDAAVECPACGFDALLEFPCYLLSGLGVTTLGVVLACARCAAEAER